MKYLAFVLMFILSSFSYASSYHFCNGKIKTVWIEGNGNVYIVGTWRNGHTKICNVVSEWKYVNPESCKTWVATAQLAYASKADITIRYHRASAQSCSTIPTYGDAPAPNYLMLTEH